MGKSSETQTSTMDPRQERYISENIEPLASEIAGMEFTPFTGERVQQLTPLQRDVLGGYGNLTLPSELTEATDIYRSVAQMTPEELSQRRGGYQQEYMDAILDPQRRRLRREQAIQRTGDKAAITGAKAFGSRGDVFSGEREAARDVAMGALEADIARQGLEYGGQRLAQDLGLTMGAAGSLAGAGMTGLQGQMGILGAKMGAGEAERLIGQQGLDAAYQQYLMQQQFPLTQFSALTGGSAAFPAGIGTTTGTTYDPMGSLGKAAGAFGNAAMGYTMLTNPAAAAAMMSDERLKEDIKLDSTQNGVNFYTWKWNKKANEMGLSGGDFGVIAQEVEQHMPHVVSIGNDGYRRVNYTKLYQELGA